MSRWTCSSLLPLLLVVARGTSASYGCDVPDEWIIDASNDTEFSTSNFHRGSKWPMGVIPYELHPNLALKDRREIERAFDDFHSKTCIQFINRRADDRNFILIELDSRVCGLSQICMQGGRQTVKFGRGCRNWNVMVHELGHTLCMGHEQSRRDRDEYLEFRDTCSRDEIPRIDWDNDLRGSLYDYSSQMHSTCGWCGGGWSRMWGIFDKCGPQIQEGLSTLDADKLNDFYDGRGCRSHRWKPIDRLSHQDKRNLVQFGVRADGRPLYACRGYAWGQMAAGTFDLEEGTCEIAWGGDVVVLRRQAQVFTWPGQWEPSSEENPPYRLMTRDDASSERRGRADLVPAGRSNDGHTEYIAVATLENSNGGRDTVVGKVGSFGWYAFFPLEGREVTRLNDYRVLTCEPSTKTGEPDGVWTDKIIGINGKFPGPLVEAQAGDTLQIVVYNQLSDQNITMHWHGIHQIGTPYQDGPSQITQCPIRPGSYQIYKFPVPLEGTYWYHSHVNSQYTAGLWGGLIVRSRDNLYRSRYYQEIVITLNDWYHSSTIANDDWIFDKNSAGVPPYPFSVLMNGMGRYPCSFARRSYLPCTKSSQLRPIYRVAPGKTYRLRLINASGYTAFNFSIDGHSLQTIEVDGVDTVLSDETAGSAAFIAAGQRYSFLVRMNSNTRRGSRFLIRANARKDILFNPPGSRNINPYKEEALISEVTGVLQYGSTPRNYDVILKHSVESFDYSRSNPEISWSDLRFVKDEMMMPLDGITTPGYYDKNVELEIKFVVDENGVRRGTFNGRPFVGLDNRPLLSKFIRGDPIPPSLSPRWINTGDVVQVVVNNPERGPHPIHLHGHHFWVLGEGDKGDGNYVPGTHKLNLYGPRRDTVMVKEESWLVIRFLAVNPGVWTLHCHIDWHMLSGMMMTFIEGFPRRYELLPVPTEARAVCAAHGLEF